MTSASHRPELTLNVAGYTKTPGSSRQASETQLLCDCLALLESELIARGAPETYRGQAWSDNCREWVYFDVVLDTDALAARFDFPASVTVHENTDPKSGLERGFYCNQHQDAVMGRITGAPTFPPTEQKT